MEKFENKLSGLLRFVASVEHSYMETCLEVRFDDMFIAELVFPLASVFVNFATGDFDVKMATDELSVLELARLSNFAEYVKELFFWGENQHFDPNYSNPKPRERYVNPITGEVTFLDEQEDDEELDFYYDDEDYDEAWDNENECNCDMCRNPDNYRN